MNYRSAVILSRWTWGSGDQVKIIDVNLSKPISRICINAELVNSSYTWVDHPAKAIKSIQLVDGSDVLFSMDGGACQGVAFYGTKTQPHLLNIGINLDTARACYTLDFGRFLFDPLFALDPTQFGNLQLKLGIDRSLGVGSPGSAFLTVTADVFDEKVPSLLGFLRSKEVYSYAPTDDLCEYIDLPTDDPYRMIVVKACAEEEGAVVQAEEIKLSEDQGAHIILEERTEQYLERMASQWPWWVEYFAVRGLTGGQSFYISPTFAMKPVGIMEAYADHYIAISWQGGQLQTAYHSGGGDIAGWVTGMAPNGCIPIVFGDIMNPDDFWSPSHLKSLRLQIDTRATNACDQTDSYNKIIVQQVKGY